MLVKIPCNLGEGGSAYECPLRLLVLCNGKSIRFAVVEKRRGEQQQRVPDWLDTKVVRVPLGKRNFKLLQKICKHNGF